ncbi:hypothetical protein D3C73_1233820 [compost metagenome]
MQKVFFTQEQIVFNELLNQTEDAKLLSKGIELGIASTVNGLLKWVEELETKNIQSFTPKQLKYQLEESVGNDGTIKEYLNRLQKVNKI